MANESSPAERNRARERLLRLTGTAVSIVTLGAVVVWATRQPAPELPGDPGELAALAAAVAVLALGMCVRGERAQWLLRRSGAAPLRADAYGLTVVGYMGNTVLPARGGDAVRVYLQAPRAATPMRNVVGILIAERALDAVTLLTVFAVLAFGVLRGIPVPDTNSLALIAGIAVAVAALCAMLTYLARGHPIVQRGLVFAAPMTRALRDLRGRHGAAMLGLTLTIWALEATVYLLVGVATGLALGPLDALYIVAVASVFVLIPAGPGYAGTLDAAVVFGVRAVGGSGAAAVSYLITLRFVLLVPVAIAGLTLLLVRYGGFGAFRTRGLRA